MECSKCGGDGPFPTYGNRCKACRAEYKAAWYQKRLESGWKQSYRYTYKKERDVAKTLRYKARHPERYKEFQNRKRRKKDAKLKRN